MSGNHSILAPSGSHRWARCVGALRMSKNIPDQTSQDAASGTCTHWMGEQGLAKDVPPSRWLGQEMEFDGFKFTVDQDRVDRATAYVDAIQREPGQRYVERRLNTSPILGVPGQEGHADVITADEHLQVEKDGRTYTGIISVHDLKDGAELIYARDNPQGLVYLATAMYEHDIVYPWQGGRFCIHQPRMNHYDEWFYTREEVAAFVLAIRPPAKLAYDLYHDVIPLEDKYLNPGKEQCHWCPVRGSCAARARHIIELFESADHTVERHLLTDPQISAYYPRLDEIRDWANDIGTEALRRAFAGRTPTNYKIVRGKRGNREFTDLKLAEVKLRRLLPLEQIFEPASVISPTAAEKALKVIHGKKEGFIKYKEELADLVTQADGSLTLAPLSDKRDAVKITPVEFAPVTGNPNDDLL